MTKGSELREMSKEQLEALLRETTEQLFRLRLQAQTERLDAPSELRKHRRLIARIKDDPDATGHGGGQPGSTTKLSKSAWRPSEAGAKGT